ncbi:MAG: hypothetical protein U5K79_18300 [Cyclobacteriaceae bacterium]|nr:hypothetical protein [Cyclobacteriaceae bacterium]
MFLQVLQRIALLEDYLGFFGEVIQMMECSHPELLAFFRFATTPCFYLITSARSAALPGGFAAMTEQLRQELVASERTELNLKIIILPF